MALIERPRPIGRESVDDVTGVRPLEAQLLRVSSLAAVRVTGPFRGPPPTPQA